MAPYIVHHLIGILSDKYWTPLLTLLFSYNSSYTSAIAQNVHVQLGGPSFVDGTLRWVEESFTVINVG